jgi:hypothetical protein
LIIITGAFGAGEVGASELGRAACVTEEALSAVKVTAGGVVLFFVADESSSEANATPAKINIAPSTAHCNFMFVLLVTAWRAVD